MTGLRVNMLIGFLLTIWACLMFPEFSTALRLPVLLVCMGASEFYANDVLSWEDAAVDLIGCFGGEIIIFMLGGKIV